MEKNEKDLERERTHFGQSSVFYYDELTLLVFSNLSIADLHCVKFVCKKWSSFILKPELWIGFVERAFGHFLGQDYRNIINKLPPKDLIKIVHDPIFARSVLNMEKYVVPEAHPDPQEPSCFGIPLAVVKKTMLEHLFSDKPIWRSPRLTNDFSEANPNLFMMPYFQPHHIPQSDAIFTHLIFHLLMSNVRQIITSTELWDLLDARAKTADRPKAIAIMCQWMANYNWKEYAAQLDPLLDVFLDSATAEERRQIEHAKHLGTLSKVYDWEMHDRTFMRKRHLQLIPANIKPKLLHQPIKLLHVPVQEMAKQLALKEHKLFRDLTHEFFIYRRWMVEPYNAYNVRFNKIVPGLIHWILTQKSMDKRCEAIGYLIHLAHELVQLRCFSGAMFIYAALNNSSISRLNSTIKVTKKCTIEYEAFRKAVSPDAGYRVLHEALQIRDKPTTPFLGVALTDLTFIEDGNHIYTEQGHINVRKWILYLQTVCACLQHQLTPYLFEPVEPLQQLWEDFATVETNDNQLYELSVALKPPGADQKEKDHPPKKK